jgi:hypothetical protein
MADGGGLMAEKQAERAASRGEGHRFIKIFPCVYRKILFYNIKG